MRKAVLVTSLWWAVASVNAATLVVVSRCSSPVTLKLPGLEKELQPDVPTKLKVGGSETSFVDRQSGKSAPIEVVSSAGKVASGPLKEGRFNVVVVTDDNGMLYSGIKLVVHDTNDLQLAISAAAHECLKKENSVEMPCVAQGTFGGLAVEFIQGAFRHLWQDIDYWKICNAIEPQKPVRTSQSKAGYQVEILRETPLVAAVRGYISPDGCKRLLKHANLDDLVVAHVGAGGGSTATSESRETLTTNMFVNWDLDNILSQSAAKTFDMVSELLGTEVPYEGQEPVNFLHYVPGYEYKPHTDGAGHKTMGPHGSRVATTLIYCEAPAEGGSTIFPVKAREVTPLRFQPGVGDMLFFEYGTPQQVSLQTHAACPVIAGNKSTLTQWHRLGVGVDAHWDQFEDWGRFHNPHGKTRWKGPRYGAGIGKSEL